MTSEIKNNSFSRAESVKSPVDAPQKESASSHKTARVSQVIAQTAPLAPQKSAPSKFLPARLNQVPGRPPGIPNKGNSCFGATVIQVIANVDPLALHLPELASGRAGAYLNKVLPVYQKEKQEGARLSRLPIQEIREAFPHSVDNDENGIQQDAHEMLLGIIGSGCVDLDPRLELKTQLEIYKQQLESPLACLKTVRKTVAVAKDLSLDKTRLVRVPGHPDRAVAETHSIEIPVLNVNLLADRKTKSVHPLPALLQYNYFSRFLLQKETYRSANVEGPILKDEIVFDRLPEVLIINLIRQGTKIDPKGRFIATKFDHEVPVPATLSAPPNATPHHEKGDYDLRAYIVQLGTAQGGHYVAFVKTTDEKGDRYWFCNDAQVDYIPQEMFEANARHSYVVLYSKKPSSQKTEALEFKE